MWFADCLEDTVLTVMVVCVIRSCYSPTEGAAGEREDGGGGRCWEGERERNRQTDRHRQTDRQTDRQREAKTQRERQRQRQTDRQTETERDREALRERQRGGEIERDREGGKREGGKDTDIETYRQADRQCKLVRVCTGCLHGLITRYALYHVVSFAQKKSLYTFSGFGG